MIFGFDPSDDFDKSSGVTETLKNSFSMYNAWAGRRIRVSDWSNYFSDRKRLKGVDSSHIVTPKENDILKKYFDGQNALSKLTEGTEEYTQKSQELEKSLLGTSDKVKKLAEEGSLAGVKVSKFADTFDKTSKSLSGFSKIASAAANIFTTFLISEGINLIIKGVQTLEEKNEKLVQSAQEVSDAYKDAQSSYSSNIKTLDSVAEEYNKLVKGVDSDGNNISLTSDEYERFQSVMEQIINVSPDIVSSYDAQGNAVLDYKNALQQAREEQEKLNQESIDKYINSGSDVFAGAKASVAKDAVWSSANGNSSIGSWLGNLQDSLYNALPKGVADKLGLTTSSDILSGGINLDAFGNVLRTSGDLGDGKRGAAIVDIYNKYLDGKGFVEQVEAVNTYYDEIIKTLKDSGGYKDEGALDAVKEKLDSFKNLSETIDAANSDIEDYLKVYLSQSDTYKSLPTKYLEVFNNNLENVVDVNESEQWNKDAADKYTKDFKAAIDGEYGFVTDLNGYIQDASKGKIASGDVERYNLQVKKLKEKLDNEKNFSSEAANAISEYYSKQLSNISVIDTDKMYRQFFNSSGYVIKNGDAFKNIFAGEQKRNASPIEYAASLGKSKPPTPKPVLTTEATHDKNEFDKWYDKLSSEKKELVMSLYLNTDDAYENIDKLDDKLNEFIDSTGKLTDAGEIMTNRLKSDIELLTEGFSSANDAATNFKKSLEDIQGGNDYDSSFNSYKDALDAISNTQKNGTYGSKEFQLASDYIFGEGWDDEKSWDEKIKFVENKMSTITKLFGTYTDSKGNESKTYGYGFLEELYKLQQNGAFKDIDGFVTEISKKSNGGFDFNIDPSEISVIAKKMGITEDAAWSCLNALKEISDVDVFDNDSFDRLLNSLNKTKGYENIISKTIGDDGNIKGIILDMDKLNSWAKANNVELDEMQDEIDYFKKNGGLTLDFTTDADSVFKSLKALQTAYGGIMEQSKDAKGNNLNIVNIDNLGETLKNLGKTDDEIYNIINGLKTIKENNPELNLNLKTKNKGGVDGYLKGLNTSNKTTQQQLEDTKAKAQQLDQVTLVDIQNSFDALNGKVNTVKGSLSRVNDILKEIQDRKDLNITVSTKTSTEDSDSKDTKGSGKRTKGHKGHKKKKKKASVRGTAFSKGKWGAKTSESSLIGEVEPEIWVHSDTGDWELVDNPKFGNVRKGDIIFNGSQTKDLLESGDTPKFGKAYSVGKGSKKKNYNGSVDPRNNGNTGGSDKSKTKDKTKSKSTDKKKTALEKFQDWIDKFFDWIEVRLDRLKTRAEQFQKKAELKVNNQNYGTYNTSKHSASTGAYKQYYNAMNVTGTLINENNRGAKRYTKQANSVLNKAKKDKLINSKQLATIKKRVANGTIDISKYGEKMRGVIEEYKNWYDKSLECQNNVLEFTDQYTEYAEAMYNLPIKKAEAKLDKLQNKQDIAEAKYDVMIGAANKNNVLSTKTSYAKSQRDIYVKEATETTKNLNDAKSRINGRKKGALSGLSSKDKDKIINAAKNGQEIDWSQFKKLSNKGKKAIIEYNEALKANEQATTDASKAEYEYTKTVRQNAKEIFDNIVTDYERSQSEISYQNNLLSEKISQLENKGYVISQAFYERQAQLNRETQASLESEITSLLAQQATVEAGTDEWWEMQSTINDTAEAIEKCKSTTEELAKAIRDLNDEKFDYFQDLISDLSDENDFLIETLSLSDLYDDNGNVTNEGIATYGLRVANLKIKQQQAAEYGRYAKQALSEYRADTNNKEALERYRKYIQLQRESLQACKDEKEAVKSLVEDGINKQLDALQKLIDKRKDALQSEKDLYDYQKNIKSQVKELTSLEKQLSAYTGDNSEETKAKLQQLRVSFESAKEDLQDTEYDKYISDQESMLDDLYDRYEEVLNARLDDIDRLIDSVSKEVNNNATTISNCINTTSNKIGYPLQDNNQYIIQNAGNINNIVDVLNSIKSTVEGIYNGNSPTSLTSPGTTRVTAGGNVINISPNGVSGVQQWSSENSQGDGKINVGDVVSFVSENGKRHYYDDSKGNGRKEITNANSSEFVVKRINSGAKYPYYLENKNGKKLGWVNKSQIQGYAIGSQGIKEDEFAWTQEDGSEIIIRKSDGAMLTPLGRGDMIFDKDASKNLWDLAHNKISIGNSRPNSIRNISRIGGNTQNDIKLDITLPNVKNYEEFKRDLTNDKQFEKVLQAMTIDRLNGANSFGKYKY